MKKHQKLQEKYLNAVKEIQRKNNEEPIGFQVEVWPGKTPYFIIKNNREIKKMMRDYIINVTHESTTISAVTDYTSLQDEEEGILTAMMNQVYPL